MTEHCNTTWAMETVLRRDRRKNHYRPEFIPDGMHYDDRDTWVLDYGFVCGCEKRTERDSRCAASVRNCRAVTDHTFHFALSPLSLLSNNVARGAAARLGTWIEQGVYSDLIQLLDQQAASCAARCRLSPGLSLDRRSADLRTGTFRADASARTEVSPASQPTA